MATSVSERFWGKVQKDPGGCWIWTAGLTREGYGKFSFRGKTIQTHRIAYLSEVGPIPDEAVLDHLCKNRACCNPAHLQPISRLENVLRGDSEAAKNFYKGSCSRGHAFTDTNTYVRPDTRARQCRQCMREATSRYHTVHPDRALDRVRRFRDRRAA